jgi:hypothetical protein
MIVLSVFSLHALIFYQPQSLAQDCPSDALAHPKGNTLYLYFPTTSDNTFPEYGIYGATTSPAEPFNVADLDSGIGTTAELRQRIFEMVTDDYCEFDVEVISMTSSPNPTEAQWQIAAIGSDSETVTFGVDTYDLFGIAQAVDIGNIDPQDYARIYAGTFEVAYGSAGEALAGTGSTLERWATAIAETTSHEASHNYGVQHDDADPRPGSAEDAAVNHIIATGTTLTGEDRASLDRHFSDTAYEILGANLGLTYYTLYNWDFVNPNDEDAHALQLEILSEANTLTIGWFYTGSSSPWTSPTISATGATTSFQGTTYNNFELDFSTGKSWSGGSNGVVPPGIKFHIGASFLESDAVIVRDTKLFDSGGIELPLAPRIFGYDDGTLDTSTGDFELTFTNFDVDRPLILRSLEVSRVPRMIDINSMVENATLVGRTGFPVTLTTSCQWAKDMVVEDRISISIAGLMDERTVDFTYDPEDCEPGIIGLDGSLDIDKGGLEYCAEGTVLSLFPSTYIYVTATVVDPEAKYWDPIQGDFIEGPLETKIFYQFAGFKPDLNNNTVDDLIDIRTGTSVDENGNGIPDEVEKQPEPPKQDPPYESLIDRLRTLLNYIYLLLAAIIALISFFVYRLRRAG